MNAIVQIIGVAMLVLTPLLLVVSGVVFFFACQFRRDQKRDEATRVVTEGLKRANEDERRREREEAYRRRVQYGWAVAKDSIEKGPSREDLEIPPTCSLWERLKE